MRIPMTRWLLFCFLGLGGCEWPGNGNPYPGHRADSGPVGGLPPAAPLCAPPQTPTPAFACRSATANFNRVEVQVSENAATPDVIDILYELVIRDTVDESDAQLTRATVTEEMTSRGNIYRGDAWRLEIDALGTQQGAYPARLYPSMGGTDQAEELTCEWTSPCQDSP